MPGQCAEVCGLDAERALDSVRGVAQLYELEAKLASGRVGVCWAVKEDSPSCIDAGAKGSELVLAEPSESEPTVSWGSWCVTRAGSGPDDGAAASRGSSGWTNVSCGA